MKKQLNLFESQRITYDECIDLTIQSMIAYGSLYKHWVFAWSGGKDSTALVTIVLSLITSGQIPKPDRITVLYADTRLELTPLAISAEHIMKQLREKGIDVRVVMAPIDKRFFVYMFGRGVPPPNNGTLRWCTPQIKIYPMQDELKRIYEETNEKFLLLTGVRQGESAIRDQRIVMSCGKDGAECGQGWYQQMPVDHIADKLAPLLHWRVCSVWDWLKLFAPMKRFGAWETSLLADAYGGEEAEEINARTGCIGCPLASRDKALETILKQYPEKWGHLKPLLKLKPLYKELRLPHHRLRKWGETNQDGKPSSNPYRMGPLTMEAREYGLNNIIDIQNEVNKNAPDDLKIDILNQDEVNRIRELWSLNTWPNKWDGTEARADQSFIHEGESQYSLFGN